MAHDLRLFYVFRLLSTSYLFVPVSVWFALSRGLGLVEVGLLKAVYAGMVILSEVPTGVIADRVGRRRAMMAGAFAMCRSTRPSAKKPWRVPAASRSGTTTASAIRATRWSRRCVICGT